MDDEERYPPLDWVDIAHLVGLFIGLAVWIWWQKDGQ